ncbi:hypothetical protein M422DRAFT_195066, partial [Sphaerobolus stellatus SS14]
MLELIGDLQLTLCTPVGQHTFFSDTHGTWSTLDLVFATEDLAKQVIECSTQDGHGLDHCTIKVQVDLTLPRKEKEQRRQFREVDWDDFRKELEEVMARTPTEIEVEIVEDVDRVVKWMVDALQEMVEKVVPVRRQSVYAKKWWTKDLTKMMHECKKVRRQAAKRTAPLDAWVRARALQNQYEKVIRAQKKLH